jgi:predicted HTH transcriptional regulator
MARVLYLRKTIEAWRCGINLIFSSCRDEGRLPPSVTERNGFVKVVFPRVNPLLRKGADLTAKSPNKIRGKVCALMLLLKPIQIIGTTAF